MENKFYESKCTSEPLRVKEMVTSVLAFIQTNFPALNTEDMGDLRLIFSELLFNATIHGNGKDANKSVTIQIELANDAIYAIITDEGAGFDYDALLSLFATDDNLTGESGRGIRLVRSLTDKLAFNVTGNEIKFFKRMASNE